jgi:hypothetical protein
MTDDPQSEFEAFLAYRHAAAAAFVGGAEQPFLSIVSESLGTFFGPTGGIFRDSEETRAQYRLAASRLRDGAYRFERIASGVSGDIGWLVGIQWGSEVPEGGPFKPQFDVRVTEIYRREDGIWRLIHRHGDRHQPPAAASPAP